jgi:hypothetical protein
MTYGTPEYYANGFADYLADVDASNPETSTNLIKGFLLAVDEWLEYHQDQVYEYESIRERVRQALPV